MRNWLMAVTLTAGLLMAAALASAEIVGRAGDEYIHHLTTPEGGDIYFTGLEEEPYVRTVDANFDGHDDLAISVNRGASNFFDLLFIWDGAGYVQAAIPVHDGRVCNMSLYPEWGLVTSSVNDGYAGVLGSEAILTWEGTRLRMLRLSVSDTDRDVQMDGQTMTTVEHFDRIRTRIYDFTNGVPDGEVIWDKVHTTMDYAEGTAVHEREAALWQGIGPGKRPDLPVSNE